jgi:hypothetical protein
MIPTARHFSTLAIAPGLGGLRDQLPAIRESRQSGSDFRGAFAIGMPSQVEKDLILTQEAETNRARRLVSDAST